MKNPSTNAIPDMNGQVHTMKNILKTVIIRMTCLKRHQRNLLSGQSKRHIQGIFHCYQPFQCERDADVVRRSDVQEVCHSLWYVPSSLRSMFNIIRISSKFLIISSQFWTMGYSDQAMLLIMMFGVESLDR